MKFALAFLSGLMATTVAGLAIPQPEAQPEDLIEREAEPETMPAVTSALSDASILTIAAQGWAKDANLVSTFIDNVYYKKFRSQAQYLKAAKAALAAEEAEWALKETLADYLNDNSKCQAANSTLTDDSTWENVKELLEELISLDWKNDYDEIQEIIGMINHGDGSHLGRCDAILPAFNTYYSAASALVKKLGGRSFTPKAISIPGSCSAVSRRNVLEG